MEKRALIRDWTHIPVACMRLTTRSLSDVFQGKMLNCSCGGICIELNQRIQNGSIVMIKAIDWIEKESPPEVPQGFRTLSIAEVKWSRPLDDKRSCNYEIGLRYLPN